jgi:nucleoside-diphosphate-sugar epimerase
MNILVTGGAGYVGSLLVPRLLELGHRVTVLDLFLFGDTLPDHPELKKVKGDIRNSTGVRFSLLGCEAVIHLACISNDPSAELDHALTKSINLDAFRPLVQACRNAGVKRFINASSSSVYGIQEGTVTEDAELRPMTDYARYKAACERILEEEKGDMVSLHVRPGTLCGYAPRQRLDLIVNIFVNQAVNEGKIRVFGGEQYRPALHIQDMVAFYVCALEWEAEKINGRRFNLACSNFTAHELATIVQSATGASIEIAPVNDNRSYNISSDQISRDLEFEPCWNVGDAAQNLKSAFSIGLIPDPGNPRYYNVQTMKLAGLK